MITTIGTPASHRIMSRNTGRSPSGRGRHGTATLREFEQPRRHGIVTMLPALHGGPPGGAEREDQPRGGDEARHDGRAARLVGGLAGGGNGIVDAPLGLLLGDAGALGDDLREVGAVRLGERPAGDGRRENAGDLRARVVALLTPGGPRPRRRRGGRGARLRRRRVVAWATVCGRNRVSSTASIGSVVAAVRDAALPATSAPVRAAAPAVAMKRAAPIRMPTPQTSPPCSPSRNSTSCWVGSCQRARMRPAT